METITWYVFSLNEQFPKINVVKILSNNDAYVFIFQIECNGTIDDVID